MYNCICVCVYVYYVYIYVREIEQQENIDGQRALTQIHTSYIRTHEHPYIRCAGFGIEIIFILIRKSRIS